MRSMSAQGTVSLLPSPRLSRIPVVPATSGVPCQRSRPASTARTPATATNAGPAPLRNELSAELPARTTPRTAMSAPAA